jgi:CTD small phosphatase-like protein 2
VQHFAVPKSGPSKEIHDVLCQPPLCVSVEKMDRSDAIRAMNLDPSVTGKQFTLVLDLDETLVHASHDHEDRPMEADFKVFDDETHQYFKVWKRPYLDVFLQSVSKWYELVIYTASYACYADPIIDSIDRRCVIARRLYNTSVVLTPDGGYEKDLSLGNPLHFPERLVMVDNSPGVCRTHTENLLVIESFRADNPSDDALLRLIPLLEALTHTEDVRCVLHRKKYMMSKGVGGRKQDVEEAGRGEQTHG